MQSIAFKSGTSFVADVSFTPTVGGPADLSGLTVTSQVRKGSTLVAELLVVKAVDNLSFTISAPLGTATWPVGQLLCDLRFAQVDGSVFYSESFEINTTKPVTLPATP
jgi:hypothetical protein